jgi:hypothetical protein
MLAILSLTAELAVAAAVPTTSVPWSEVQAAIAKTICVLPQPNLPDGYFVRFGDREACGASAAATPVDRAVDTAIDEARPLLVDVPSAYDFTPNGLTRAYAPKEEVERNRIARDIFLGSETFVRPLVPRIVAALSAEGLTCIACPIFETPKQRLVNWDAFFPYVSGFISPDPVKAVVGPDGKVTGKSRYSFHICSGLDPARSMTDPDRVLLRAGFVAAFATDTIRPQTGEHFGDILAEQAFKELTTDEARTQYLRRRLPEELRKDPIVRENVCATMSTYGPDLGVTLQGCADAESN